MSTEDVGKLYDQLFNGYQIDFVGDKYYFSFDPNHLNTVTDLLSEWFISDLIPIIMVYCAQGTIKQPERNIRVLTFDFTLGSVPVEVRDYVPRLYIGARHSVGNGMIKSCTHTKHGIPLSSKVWSFVSPTPYNIDLNAIMRLLPGHCPKCHMCSTSWTNEMTDLIEGYVAHIERLHQIHDDKPNDYPIPEYPNLQGDTTMEDLERQHKRMQVMERKRELAYGREIAVHTACSLIRCMHNYLKENCVYISIQHYHAHKKYTMFLRGHYPRSQSLELGQHFHTIARPTKRRKVPTQ